MERADSALRALLRQDPDVMLADVRFVTARPLKLRPRPRSRGIWFSQPFVVPTNVNDAERGGGSRGFVRLLLLEQEVPGSNPGAPTELTSARQRVALSEFFFARNAGTV